VSSNSLALPKPAKASADPPEVRELLAFELADERYALPLSSVREIMRVPAVTEVPRAPDAVIGVISARGRVTTVLDLRRRLRLAEKPWTNRTRVLLVDHDDEVIGLLVDAVLQVQRLSPKEIELSSVLGGTAPPHLIGIGRPAPSHGARTPGALQELLLLLDLAPLLAFDRSVAR
jgi:purine-binding chemotaxis protein CheW